MPKNQHFITDSDGRRFIRGGGGVLYELLLVPKSALPSNWEGSCDGPHIAEPKVKVLRTLRGKRRLMQIIDETIHTRLWDLDNETVAEMAAILADVLWGLGYRGDPKAAQEMIERE